MYRNTSMAFRIIESFFRYRYLFALSMITITVIPAVVICMRKPTYYATALTQLAPEDVATVLGPTNTNNSWISVAQQNTNRFNELLSDDSPGGFLATALENAHLREPIHVDPKYRDRRLVQLRKDLSVNPTSETVFAINLVWDDPAECEQIVKAFQSRYIEETGTNQEVQSAAVVKFLDAELEKYAGRLRIAEQAVIDFKRNNSGQSQEAQTAEMDQLTELKIQMNNLEVSAHNNDLKREVLQKRIARVKPTSVVEQRITKSPLYVKKSELEAQRTVLMSQGWLPTSNGVQALDSQIKVVKDSLDAEIKADPSNSRNVTETVLQDNSEYQDLQNQITATTVDSNTRQAQIEGLRKRIAEYEGRLARLPVAEANLNDRIRDFTILKNQYEDLLKRREQARLKTSLDKISATSALHGIGTVYAQPTLNKTKTALMLCGLLMVGLAVGVGVTVLAESVDPALRYASDVPRRLGVPLLLSLPEMESLQQITATTGQARGRGPV